ncbi:1,4-dihydroxy-2-naphthoate octaprenyltransferase [uncultured archaeon]|nr:1,4-dihydroxy-2-naphthoate octaprenyltransferase [uncultured archaeon]
MSNCIVVVEGMAKKEWQKRCKELRDTLTELFSFLTVSSLFIGGTGFFKTYVAYVLLGMEPEIKICFVGFLLTFSVYSLNKLTDLKEDAINMPERLRFLKGRKRLVLAYSLAAFLLAMLLTFLQTPLAVPIVFVPLASNIIYSSKLLAGIPRFKDIPVMKNLFVAASWALCATLFPLVCTGNTAVALSMMVFYFILGKSFINTVLYDIRDEVGDRENKVRTIPVLLGSRKTICLLMTMNGTLLAGLLMAAGYMQPRALVITLAMVFYGFAYIFYFRKRRNPLVLDFFVDGEWMHATSLYIVLNVLGLLA